MIQLGEQYLKPLLLQRVNNTHKGSYGHLLIVAGRQDMPGAAVLATCAALQSGCGLVTLHSTERALNSASANCPSAMLSLDRGPYLSEMPANLSKYDAICIGPGLGKAVETQQTISKILTYSKNSGIPVLLDADALNFLAQNPDEMGNICEDSILTPHTVELRRLLDSTASSLCKCGISPSNLEFHTENTDETDKNGECPNTANSPLENSIFNLCKQTKSTIIAKGYHSRIFTQDGKLFQNMSGGPGLAKAGSGDVLAGLTAGLMARGYCGSDAAILGTWIHGKAGDMLSIERTMESFSSFDLANKLFPAFKLLYS